MFILHSTSKKEQINQKFT